MEQETENGRKVMDLVARMGEELLKNGAEIARGAGYDGDCGKKPLEKSMWMFMQCPTAFL